MMTKSYFLVNQKPGHNKFYEIKIDTQFNVHTRWGRIGQKGRINPTREGRTEWGAESIVQEIKRRRKDYCSVDEATIKMLEIQAVIMGTSTKVLQIWVNIIQIDYASVSVEFINESQLNNPKIDPGLIILTEDQKRKNEALRREKMYLFMSDNTVGLSLDCKPNINSRSNGILHTFELDENDKFINKIKEAALVTFG